MYSYIIHMGFALILLFVCGWVVGVKGLFKRVCAAVLESKDTADIAHTSACYRRMIASACENLSALERSKSRRRRRIFMRRNRGQVPDDVEEMSPGSDSEERQLLEGSTVIGIPVASACFSWAPGNGRALVIRDRMPRQLQMPAALVPVIGAVSVAGRQRCMEDTVSIKTNLCSPLINYCRPVHYFGVFDGHGGSHFAVMCKDKLHAILKEELMGVPAGQNQIEATAQPLLPPPGLISEESVLQEKWRIVISRVFSRTETAAFHTCGGTSVGSQCSCPVGDVSFTGTTAVTVVLTEKHIVAGNCGDSRAVLFRAGRIIPLTFDHKPDRADEKARILASGGLVINADTARVQGILAVSRAIGDLYLKPYLISEPEVTFTRRSEEDEFLIIASDGMWDVLPTKLAGQVTLECLKAWTAGDGSIDLNLPPEDESIGFPSASAMAASLLTRLAIARKSSDNISVVVIDLKRGVGGVGNNN